jgi:hypothetical protein
MIYDITYSHHWDMGLGRSMGQLGQLGLLGVQGVQGVLEVLEVLGVLEVLEVQVLNDEVVTGVVRVEVLRVRLRVTG